MSNQAAELVNESRTLNIPSPIREQQIIRVMPRKRFIFTSAAGRALNKQVKRSDSEVRDRVSQSDLSCRSSRCYGQLNDCNLFALETNPQS